MTIGAGTLIALPSMAARPIGAASALGLAAPGSSRKAQAFAALLPLILLQAAGYRRPIKSERAVSFVFGGGLGVLYSVTTISGPVCR